MAKKTKQRKEEPKIETGRLEVNDAEVKSRIDKILSLHPTAKNRADVVREAISDFYIKITTSVAVRNAAAKLDAAPKPLSKEDWNRIADEYQAEVEKEKKEEEK